MDPIQLQDQDPSSSDDSQPSFAFPSITVSGGSVVIGSYHNAHARHQKSRVSRQMMDNTFYNSGILTFPTTTQTNPPSSLFILNFTNPSEWCCIGLGILCYLFLFSLGYLEEQKVVVPSAEYLLNPAIPIYAVLARSSVEKTSFIAKIGGRHLHTGELPSLNEETRSRTKEVEFYHFYSGKTGHGYIIDTPDMAMTSQTTTARAVMWQVRQMVQHMVPMDKLLMGLILLWDVRLTSIDNSPLLVLEDAVDLFDDLLGYNFVARITLAVTNFHENPTLSEQKKELQSEEDLRDLWKNPESCRSAIVRYDDKLETALHIIHDFSSQNRRRHWLDRKDICLSPEPYSPPGGGAQLAAVETTEHIDHSFQPDQFDSIYLGILHSSFWCRMGQALLILVWGLLKSLWYAACVSCMFLGLANHLFCVWNKDPLITRTHHGMLPQELFLLAIIATCPGHWDPSICEHKADEAGFQRLLVSTVPRLIWMAMLVVLPVVGSWSAKTFDWPIFLTSVWNLLHICVTYPHLEATRSGQGWISSFRPHSNLVHAAVVLGWIMQSFLLRVCPIRELVRTSSALVGIGPVVLAIVTTIVLYGHDPAAWQVR